MTVTRARVTLVTIFLASLVVQAAAIVYTYLKGAIPDEDLRGLLTKLLDVYAVHLAVTFGGIFAQQQNARKGSQPERAATTAFWLATALAVIWNVLLLWRSVMFGMAAYFVDWEDSVDDLRAYMDNIAKAGSFLVAGALAFFFSKR